MKITNMNYNNLAEEKAMFERVKNFKSILDDSSNPQYQKLKAIIEDTSVRFLVSPDGQKLINEKAKILGYAFPNIIAPSAYISAYAKMGNGCVVLQNACVQNGATVGNGVLLNAGTEVHCDVAVGDYVLVYTNSVIRTGAAVGSLARIGSNCTISNNATVPDGADIPDCTAVH